jgi:beta-mannosidase
MEVTTGVAAYVWMTAPNGVTGYWDQNAVFMVKGEKRNFTFVVREATNESNWEYGVHVRSLWDNYEVSVPQKVKLLLE